MLVMHSRHRLYSLVVGGLAFWLPPIILSVVAGQNPSILWLNITPLLGLAALAFIDRISFHWPVQWNWVLAGLYILGPISILIESTLGGGSLRGLGLFGLVLLVPPMTILMSFYSAQFFVILGVTVALPLIGFVSLVKEDLHLLRNSRASARL